MWQTLREVLAQFKTSEFWVAMMLIAFFGVLTYFLVHYSFLTDNIMIDLKGARCLPLRCLLPRVPSRGLSRPDRPVSGERCPVFPS